MGPLVQPNGASEVNCSMGQVAAQQERRSHRRRGDCGDLTGAAILR
jgi:hypothetical protein